jgi:hypothetical protein
MPIVADRVAPVVAARSRRKTVWLAMLPPLLLIATAASAPWWHCRLSLGDVGIAAAVDATSELPHGVWHSEGPAVLWRGQRQVTHVGSLRIGNAYWMLVWQTARPPL